MTFLYWLLHHQNIMQFHEHSTAVLSVAPDLDVTMKPLEAILPARRFSDMVTRGVWMLIRLSRLWGRSKGIGRGMRRWWMGRVLHRTVRLRR